MCACVCDDGCVVESEGGVEDKQRKKERRTLKAKEESVDGMPVGKKWKQRRLPTASG